MENKITLWQGDCLELMKKIPDGSIDLVLTDPPYNIARDNNFHTMGRAGRLVGIWMFFAILRPLGTWLGVW